MIPFLAALLGRTKTLTDRLTATRASNLDYLDGAVSALSVIRSIQYGTVEYIGGGLTATATVAAVTVAKSALINLGSHTASDGLGSDPFNASLMAGLTLTNATTVTATKGYAASGLRINFCLVEFK